MPIYEFYCPECNTIFNFFSRSVNTEKKPMCPKCQKTRLERRMSVFSTSRNRGEEEDISVPDLDETKMEKAMSLLAKEAENVNEEDPRQAADLMRKLTDMTGLELGAGMREALKRMEAGEDPDAIEAEMGDLLEDEEPFLLPEKKGPSKAAKRPAPSRDETLYEL